MTQYIDNVVVEQLLTIAQKVTTVTSTVTASGTLALTVASNMTQVFTGSTAGQIVKLPDATTLVVGQRYEVYNAATVSIALQDNSGAALLTVQPLERANFLLQANGNAAGAWLFTTLEQNMVASGELYVSYPGAGLSVNYTSGIVYFGGTEFTIAAGTIALTASLTGAFVYVDPVTHVVTQGATLPNNAVAMATFTTSGSAVTALNDARQDIDRNLVWGVTGDLSSQTSQSTASGGSLEKYARADHKHAMNINLMKAGTIAAGSFAGSPKVSTVTFGAAFGSTAYSIHVTGSDGRSWIYTTKAAGSFVINAQANQALTGEVSWFAVATGEAA